MESKDKKILIFLQRRFAYWGHCLAIELKTMGYNDFACYTLPLSSAKFLQSQKDIAYKPLVVDEEVINNYKKEKIDWQYLKEAEAKYGIPNLWHYIYLDRYLIMSRQQTSYEPSYNYQEMLQILQLRLKAIEKLFDDFKPEAVLFSAIAIMPSMLVYQIAKKRGIKILQITHTRVGKQVGICETLGVYNNVLAGFEKNKALWQKDDVYYQKANDFLIEFQQKESGRAYQYNLAKPALFFKRVFQALSFILTHFYRSYFTYRKNDYVEEKFFTYLRNRLEQKYNKMFGHRGLFENIEENENFVFYPLHYEPEAATLIFAPYYVNQIELISNIAKSLPIDYKLYVKEHPAMQYRRKRSYYKKVLRNRNVCLINTAVSSQQIIKKSKLLISITSTAGFEALLLNKPVITFGECFYNIFSSVRKCQNIASLPELIKSQIAGFNKAENQKEITDYLASVFEHSVEIDLFDIWEENTPEEIKEKRKMLALAEFIKQNI